jgi:hypothetical protein
VQLLWQKVQCEILNFWYTDHSLKCITVDVNAPHYAFIEGTLSPVSLMTVYLISKPAQRQSHGGFALVIALSLMAFVLLLLLSITTLVQVETRSASIASAQMEAEQAALLGLQVALGELQKAAGPDQRVTATADIIDDSANLYTGGTTVPTGQGSWTGVWRSDTVAVGTPSYSPATPNTRSFVGWLVSGTDANGDYELPTALADVVTNVNSTGSTNGIPNYVSLFNKSDGTSYAQVEKVRVGSGSDANTYFAFHVEDESVKADLSWSETPATGAGPLAQARAQDRRLSAAPGPDFGALNGVDDNGPFGSVTYPLTIDSSAILADILKVQDPSDLTTTMSDPSAASKWLKDNRGDMTWGSRGVMADVKWGGLRRDLSLAFEMDGDADVTASEQPTKFNLQVGEFVGGTDRLAAPQAALGMNDVKERFLYRDVQGSGTPFSGDLVRGDSVVRGPNWWALRDYANMYKRLEKSNGSYRFEARSYFPNRSIGGWNYDLGFMVGKNSGASTWDHEVTNPSNPVWVGDDYIYRPTRLNHAPVLLGSVCLFSVTAQFNGTNHNLALGMDPIFYFWNPYDCELSVDRLAVALAYGMPGNVTLWKNYGQADEVKYGPNLVRDYLASYSGQATTEPQTYLIKDLELQAGEVIVMSPSSNRSSTANELHDELYLGTNTNNDSGVIVTDIPVSETTLDSNGNPVTNTVWQEVSLDLASDSISFLYSHLVMSNGSEIFWVDLYIPPAGTDAEDLSVIYLNDFGEHLQSLGNNTQGSNSHLPEYFEPPISNSSMPTGTVNANALFPGPAAKNFFAIHSYLAKPADFEGNNPNPVEVFSHFNPAPLSTTQEMWRKCMLNQVTNSISAPGDVDTLLQDVAVNFPASNGKGFWGETLTSGSTQFVHLGIPKSPMISLAAFANANFSVRASEPMKAVGNSWASPFVSPVSPYGALPLSVSTASDSSWLINDALFDRYYLSGIASDFNIGGAGYLAIGTVSDTLDTFFGDDYRDAQANPVLVPYLPDGVSEITAVADLSAADGYKKMGAYSLINGTFNVNSTSVSAWEAFLQGNRGLTVHYAQGGGSDTGSGTPFPRGASPTAPGNGAASFWAGFSRLSDDQIRDLAEEIVEEVQLRGPFMSLSDFVNHRVGRPKNNATHYMGALQAAIEDAGINATVRAGAGGVIPMYGNMSAYMPDVDPGYGTRVTSTGIPTDITQADLLLPLAPRLTARSDTFRIRAYGEVRSQVGSEVTSQAVCEAVVQRIPEYVDPDTDPTNNEPWDEAFNPLSPAASALNVLNQQFGRRFKVVSFRWLASDEI